MKLWLLRHLLEGYEDGSWGTSDRYDSAVVAAETAEAAGDMHPDDGKSIGVNRGYADDWSWPKDSAHISVSYLGEAKPGMAAGVICASFNAS